MELSSLQNIGNALADKLKTVGIDSPEQLKSAGSEKAFIRLAVIDENACINQLYALEGAVQGIRWHKLDKSRKKELTEFYNMLKKSI